MRVAKGLIIADPWIGYILDGTKDWEMRSSATSHRGWFALIRKGTGAIYGVARLVDAGSPLSPTDMIATFDHHRIPERMIRSGEVARWNTPWKLADVHRLGRPVAYRHKSGAVTWVELDHASIEGVANQLGAGCTMAVPEVAMPSVGAARPDQFSSADTMRVEIPRHDRDLHIETERDSKEPDTDTAAPVEAIPSITADRIVQSLTSPAMTTSQKTPGRVIGEVEITDGNIANNHIYLRSFFDRFPVDAVGGSNKAARAKHDLTIDWGGAEPAQTDLDGQKKFFRSRGWIGAFYQLHRAHAGDHVVVEEIAAYHYRVSLKRCGLQEVVP